MQITIQAKARFTPNVVPTARDLFEDRALQNELRDDLRLSTYLGAEGAAASYHAVVAKMTAASAHHARVAVLTAAALGTDPTLAALTCTTLPTSGVALRGPNTLPMATPAGSFALTA